MAEGDYGRVNEILRASYRWLAEREAWNDEQFTLMMDDRASLDMIEKESKVQTWIIAEQDDRLVGLVDIWRNEIAKLYVDPACHRQGIGAMLFRAAVLFRPQRRGQFELKIKTGAELETVKASLVDPAGNVVALKEGGFPAGTQLSTRVAPEHAGKVWKLTLTRAEGPGSFEDVHVSLDDNLPPYLSESPERLLLPVQ